MLNSHGNITTSKAAHRYGQVVQTLNTRQSYNAKLPEIPYLESQPRNGDVKLDWRYFFS